MSDNVWIAIGFVGWLITLVLLLGALAYCAPEPPGQPLQRRPLVRLVAPDEEP